MSATSPGSQSVDEVEASRAPLMDHLNELRGRLIKILWVILIFFTIGWFLSEHALKFLLEPLTEAGKRHNFTGNVVYQGPLELLFTQLKISFLISLAAGFPFMAWQVYGFIAPGLYKKERAAVIPFLIVMPLLFVAGGAVVYYYVLPMFSDLSFNSKVEGVTFQPKVKEYYELAIGTLTVFGLAFQLPAVMALLAKGTIVSAKTFRKWRKWAAVVIFFIAAAVTPPDPVTWCLLGFPILALYEGGIIAAAIIDAARKKRQAADEKALQTSLSS